MIGRRDSKHDRDLCVGFFPRMVLSSRHSGHFETNAFFQPVQRTIGKPFLCAVHSFERATIAVRDGLNNTLSLWQESLLDALRSISSSERGFALGAF
jgi:hypothetical protein